MNPTINHFAVHQNMNANKLSTGQFLVNLLTMVRRSSFQEVRHVQNKNEVAKFRGKFFFPKIGKA